MVGELEIIFGHHPIARQLRIARHVAIFFEQLGGVAACAAIDAVGLIAPATTLRALAIVAAVVIAAATATALTIVHRH